MISSIGSSNIKRRNLNELFAIVRDLEDFSIKAGLQAKREKKLYDRLVYFYNLGFITSSEFPVKRDVKSGIYGISLNNNYIDINFCMVTMMIDYSDLEELLCKKWLVVRRSILQYCQYEELGFLKRYGLGIRVTAFFDIHGTSPEDNAIVFTPEDIQALMPDSSPYWGELPSLNTAE